MMLRKMGLLLTPEETDPSPEIQSLDERHREEPLPLRPIPELEHDYGLLRVVVDPYVNSLHALFLHPRSNKTEETRVDLAGLRARLLKDGAPSLSRDEKVRLLSDVESIRQLHREVWSRPRHGISEWWRLALERLNRESLFRVDFHEGH